MITAFIFDLDGVIVDTAKYHYLAWKHIAGDLGFVFTEKDNERLKGVSRMQSLEILLEIGGISLPEKEKERIAAEKNALYLEYVSKMTAEEILPGVVPFIEEARRRHIRSGLGTASKNCLLILDRLGIRHLFDTIIDGNKVTKAKPDPEVFLLAAAALQVLPEQCVVFEDAQAGLEAARRAGMRRIGIGNPETLTDADFVIPGLGSTTVSEILQRLGFSDKKQH
ncbi:MAG: beta-phosphoglucomutase [Bacteroidales bacterium]